MRGRRRSQSKPTTAGRRRVVLYIRVSTEQQAENRLSLEEQELQLRAFADNEEWSVVDVVVDHGETASNLNRRAFKNLLERARSSPPPFDAITAFDGNDNWADPAGPLSPENPAVVPATVVMVPEGVTRRTRAFPVSAMYRFPAASSETPCGVRNSADVAGPLSPSSRGAPATGSIV